MSNIFSSKISETARNILFTAIIVIASFFIINLVNEFYEDIIADDPTELEDFETRMAQYEISNM